MKPKNTITLIALWLIIITTSFVWNLHLMEKNTNLVVKAQARSFFNEIQTTRAWNAQHGGVYVPITDETKPNPFLDVPNRDIYIDSLGIALTKVNPAFMTRQIGDLAKKENNVTFHITSLKPIRPQNKADEWETVQLGKFEKGTIESLEYIENDTEYRYMAPLQVKKACMKCHAKQGYQVGDIRGGISVTINGESIRETMFAQKAHILFVHIIIFIIGALSIFLFQRRSDKQILKLQQEKLKIQNINKKLVETKIKAEESDRLKSAFLTNISHEIRTPMNGIIGFLDLITLPGLTGEKQKRYIDMIRESSDRLMSTVDDIMEMSMIDSGQVEVVNESTNINRQIEKIHASFKQSAEDKGIRFSFSNTLSSDDSIINTDPGKLNSILENLVKNAIKFTTAGAIQFGYNLKPGSATAKKIKDGGPDVPAMLEFFVKDTGVGIPKEKQQTIFNRFVQADVSLVREFEGSGLGLAISKAYIEMLGGKIWVESEEADQLANKAGGSQFYFTLPYNCLTKKISAGKIDTLGVGAINPDRKLKILVAEDDEANVMYLSMVLEDLSKEILYAKTGNDAVEVCRNNLDIDLILMDIKMPEMDGLEAARQIREFNQNIIIIAQTAFAMQGDREKALEAGCNHYVAKPINKDELLEMIIGFFKK
ncbi:MAG: hypothetical protein B6D64_02000 [Bacteroidetes bacterium 4484_276]|nr:MAG: hypothetical protein B6D64_02000 [Bacteroidetes bacterium 4484_276]